MVHTLVESALSTTPNVIVAGDLNEPPQDGHLAALLNHPELTDAMAMDEYAEKSAFSGTYLTGSKSNKLDYLLLSKSLQENVTEVGVERRGYRSIKWSLSTQWSMREARRRIIIASGRTLKCRGPKQYPSSPAPAVEIEQVPSGPMASILLLS